MKTNGEHHINQPYKEHRVFGIDNYCEIVIDNLPLTKREYFAAMAMQGMVKKYGGYDWDNMAKSSVDFADALITALNNQEK